MALVPQNSFLFSGTVLENIRFGRPDASDAEVKAAVAALGVLDLIEQLAAGFETRVGERGAGLSLGQRQIVCFARALLAAPEFVLLDEATSSMDSLTEARVQTALKRLLQGRTSFVVAHRLSTIRGADLILVLDRGRIVERGRHDELYRRGGIYAALCRQLEGSPPAADSRPA
jgi:ATP-binding cassette subfamily B protein